MKQRNFIEGIQNLLPHSEKESANVWIDFTKECVEANQYANFELEGDETYEIEKWLSSIFTELDSVKREYGEDTATQICSLAAQKNCLYPFEMKECAEYLKTGTMEEFLSEWGLGDEPTKQMNLTDVRKSPAVGAC